MGCSGAGTRSKWRLRQASRRTSRRHWAGDALFALAARADGDVSVFDAGVLLNHFPPSWLPEQLDAGTDLKFFAPAAVTSGEAPRWVTERDQSRPLMYATLGTVFNGAHRAFEQFLRAADGADFDLLLTVGKDVDPRTLEGPSNARIERFVTQESILGAVSAVVCHGGMGTVMGALRHGVPLCWVPSGADHLSTPPAEKPSGVAGATQRTRRRRSQSLTRALKTWKAGS